MKQNYSVLFLDRTTRKVLKRFDYPKYKLSSRFFWEKMKAAEYEKLIRGRQLDREDVLIKDITSQ